MTEVGEKARFERARRWQKAAESWMVRVQSLRFTSDHALMTDDPVDSWKSTGLRFPEPEWSYDPESNAPITHTRAKKLEGEVTMRDWPGDAAKKNGVAEGFLGTFQMSLKAKRSESFGVGAHNRVPVVSVEPLPDAVGRINQAASWVIRVGPRDYAVGASGPHEIFLTYGPPVVGALLEDGVTRRRMALAVDWIGEPWARNRRAPEQLIEAVFGKFDSYVLDVDMSPRAAEINRSPALRARLLDAGFPQYFDGGQGGAWPLGQWWQYGGECQAIVRLTRAIARQIGLPGTIELQYVTNGPGIYDTQIRDDGGRPSGPTAGLGWALADSPVVVGRRYAVDRYEGVGFNNFEACMKYTDDRGKETWFAGGIGRLDDFDPRLGVLQFFQNGGLVGYRVASEGVRRFRQIVEYYPYKPEWNRRRQP